VKAVETTPSEVFQRLTDAENPETLREIARAWQVPAGRFIEWYTTEHAERYDAALKVRADQDAHETVEIADGTAAEEIGTAKLRIDARKWRASRWDRQRYGDHVQHQVSGRAVLKVDFSRPGAPEKELPAEDVTVLPAAGERLI
jgi:hypothetical protein